MPSVPSAPTTLSQEAATWWRRVVDEYALADEAGLLLLQTALECFTEMRRDQAVVEEVGPTVTDRWGQTKPHPLLSNVRDCRAQMMAALKALNLDLEPLKEIGRPPGR